MSFVYKLPGGEGMLCTDRPMARGVCRAVYGVGCLYGAA